VLGDGRNRHPEHLRQVAHAQLLHVLEQIEELEPGRIPGEVHQLRRLLDVRSPFQVLPDLGHFLR
jgi:predicted component of type VI protein secretion system